MEYPKVIGDRAKMNFIRYAMSRIGDASETQISVSARAPRARPFPTVVAHLLVAACPKSILQRLEEDAMTSSETCGFTVLDSCVLPATALAFPVWLKQAVRGDPGGIFHLSQMIMVVMQENARKAANLTKLRVGYRCNRRIFSAPTLTFAIGVQQAVSSYPRGVIRYVFGKCWGMIEVHKKFTFLVSKPRAFRDAAGHFLLRSYSFILAQMVEYRNVMESA